VQQLRPSANGWQRSRRVLARALDLDFLDGRRLDLAKAGRIDVQPAASGSTKGEGALTRFDFNRPGASEGATGEA
jgi:hypothetical protein